MRTRCSEILVKATEQGKLGKVKVIVTYAAILQMAVKMEGASPPVFEQIFRNARFAQGGNALFEGKVAGSPRPQVR